MSSTPSSETSFALVDCNSFYCSCERVFSPKLRGEPVVVLSNNDGVVIARTNEAKKAGIKMGEPFHLARPTMEKHGVHALSSNFPLYGDMSDRVMSILESLSLPMEIYSIDESFIDFTDVPKESVADFCNQITGRVIKETGIPVSIGVGQTKVLAKLANEIAKNTKSYVFDLSDVATQNEFFPKIPVGDIWGIGKQSAKKLNSVGIYSAMDLKMADPEDIRSLLTIVGKRIVEELRGISCLPLEMVAKDKKQIISSRSFGKPVFSIEELKEACSYYLSRACEKLRRQSSLCQEVKVFIHTNPFKAVKQFYNTGTLRLSEPTSSTIVLNRAVNQIVEAIFKEGIEYKKAGVFLNHLISEKDFKPSLFSDTEAHNSHKAIMSAIDSINSKYGKGCINLGTCGVKQDWKMASSLKSPSYTTSWADLPIVHAR